MKVERKQLYALLFVNIFIEFILLVVSHSIYDRYVTTKMCESMFI